MKKFISISMALPMLLACSSAMSMSLDDKNETYAHFVSDKNLSQMDRVSGFKYRGFKQLSNDYLIISSVGSKDYLVEIKGSCFDFDKARTIEINGSSKLSIFQVGNSISADDGRADIRRGCLIESIYPITKEQSSYLAGV